MSPHAIALRVQWVMVEILLRSYACATQVYISLGGKLPALKKPALAFPVGCQGLQRRVLQQGSLADFFKSGILQPGVTLAVGLCLATLGLFCPEGHIPDSLWSSSVHRSLWVFRHLQHLPPTREGSGSSVAVYRVAYPGVKVKCVRRGPLACPGARRFLLAPF